MVCGPNEHFKAHAPIMGLLRNLSSHRHARHAEPVVNTVIRARDILDEVFYCNSSLVAPGWFDLALYGFRSGLIPTALGGVMNCPISHSDLLSSCVFAQSSSSAASD